MIDAWIYALPAQWEALSTEESPFSYCHSQAVTGYWKTFPGGYEVYNVVGSEAEIQAIIDVLADVPHVYAWTQGDGKDSLSVWPTDPANLLAVMKDHVTYDENGNVTGTTPATLEAPNWGHCFLGQADRIFAGDFSTDFSGDFL